MGREKKEREWEEVERWSERERGEGGVKRERGEGGGEQGEVENKGGEGHKGCKRRERETLGKGRVHFHPKSISSIHIFIQ